MNTPEILHAVQHIRKMRGGSQAHLIRASDNNLYVTKFQNNPQHIRVLASEYLGTKLGILLGLPMPEVRIINVSEWLISNTPELRIDTSGTSVPCTIGLQLGSSYAADPAQDHIFDYLPESIFQRISNLEDFPRMLAFDKWTGNSDGRQAVFVKQRGERDYHAVFIDQGFCFNAGEWKFVDQPLRGVYGQNAAYRAVCGWESFEPTLSRIAGIEISQLRQITAEIPPSWYQNDMDGISSLIKTLHQRRAIVRDLISSVRTCARNPFPHWNDH